VTIRGACLTHPQPDPPLDTDVEVDAEDDDENDGGEAVDKPDSTLFVRSTAIVDPEVDLSSPSPPA
jgi:hypothetical protein